MMPPQPPDISTASELSGWIERRVADGELAPGDRLPSVRAQAVSTGLAPNTVAAAYRRLRERGLVVGRGRQGSRIAPRAHSAPPVYPAPDPRLIDAMSGNPDASRLPNLAAAAARLKTRPPVRYGDPMIDPELARLAGWSFAADGIRADHLALTSGAMDAVERTLAAQGLRVGDRIGVEDPGHGPVHTLARRMGLDLVPLPVDEFGITSGGLERALDRGLSAVVATPRAHNPTGAAFSPERAAALAAVMGGHPDLVLIQDDHAGEVAGVGFVSLTPPGPRWAIIRSVAKTYGPDLRLAMITGDEATVRAVNESIAGGPSWVSYLLQRVAASLMADPDTAELVDQAARSYAERRNLLITELAGYGITAVGRSGLNVCIPVDDEQGAVEAARSAGFAIRTAGNYQLSSGSAVRVTITGLDHDQIRAVAVALGRPSSPRSAVA